MFGESANPYRLPCNLGSWPTRKTLTFCTQQKNPDEIGIPAQCNETAYGSTHGYVHEVDCTGTWRAGNCYGDCANSTATGLVTYPTTQTVGTTTILFDGTGSGALVAGDLIKFAGDDYGYLVATGNPDMGGTSAYCIITPGLFREVAPSTPVSVVIKTTRDYSLCHKQGHKVVRARKGWHGATGFLPSCGSCVSLGTPEEDETYQACLDGCTDPESADYCRTQCWINYLGSQIGTDGGEVYDYCIDNLSLIPDGYDREYARASCISQFIRSKTLACAGVCDTQVERYRKIVRTVSWGDSNEDSGTATRSTTVNGQGIVELSDSPACEGYIAPNASYHYHMLWGQWSCGPAFATTNGYPAFASLNMMAWIAMQSVGTPFTLRFYESGQTLEQSMVINSLTNTHISITFSLSNLFTGYIYSCTSEWTLSEPYSLSSVISDAFALADSWNLSDDIQYPWMAYDYEGGVAGYHNPVPMVERRELQSGQTPDLIAYECDTFVDPRASTWDGSIIGEPLDNGVGVHYAYWDEAGTVAPRGWNPGSYTLPEAATWWTKPYSPDAPENTDCEISNWPSGGWVKVNGGMVTVQKWAQTRETVPSLNLFGPCGADRDHASFPDAWPICGRAAVASVSGSGTIAVVLSEAAPYLRTGDVVDFVSYSGSFVETVTDSNKTVTVTDETHFTFTGATPTGTHIKSHDAPHYRWYDNKPKGDALFCKSEYNFCDLSTDTTCIPDCTRFSPCYPQVMAILTDTPAETAWASKNNIAIQNLPTAPDFNGGVQYIVQANTEESDPYWTGEEADNPGVESRCEMPTTPAGAPTLPNYAYTYAACSGGVARPAMGLLGLGDAVALVAQPIARAIDAATSMLPKRLRTNVAGCGGCQKRKEALNKAVPFKTLTPPH